MSWRRLVFAARGFVCVLAGVGLLAPAARAQGAAEPTIKQQVIERLRAEGKTPQQIQDLLRGIDTKAMVEQAMADYVAGHNGVAIKMTGSWATPRGKYRDPLLQSKEISDHDAELFLSDPKQPWAQAEGLSEVELVDAWARAQTGVREDLVARLERAGLTKAEATRVSVETVNLYPPRQLMAGVETAEEAEALFARVKVYPGRTAEGLYGTKAYVQMYERTNGRLLFKDAGTQRVMKGFTDLTHLSEGVGTFSIGSSVNLSNQLAHKVEDALASGQGKDVVKQLARLDEAMVKAKDLSRLKPGARNNPLLRDLLNSAPPLDADAKTLGRWLEQNRGAVRTALDQAERERALLRMLSTSTNEMEIDILYRSLEPGGRWSKLAERAGELAQRTGQTLQVSLKALIAFAVAVEAYGVSRVYIDKGANAAAIDLGLRVIRFTNINAAMAEMVLEEVRDGTYGMVARFQDCDDLAAGIYSVKGREHTGDGRQVAELARETAEAAVVSDLVRRQAREAASRGFTVELGADAAAVERDVEEHIVGELTARCEPSVLKSWQEERAALLSKVLEAKRDLEARLSVTPLVLVAREEARPDGYTAVVAPRPAGSHDDFRQALATLEERLKDLGGSGRLGGFTVTGEYTWTLDGRVQASGRDSGEMLTRASSLSELTRTFSFPYDPERTVGFIYKLTLEPRLVGDAVSFDADGRPVIHDAGDVFHDLLAGEYTLQAALPIPTRVPGRLRLEITASDRTTGAPVAGASVHLTGSAFSGERVTDDSGMALMDDVVEGDYEVSATARGYRAFGRGMSLRARYPNDPDPRNAIGILLDPIEEPAPAAPPEPPAPAATPPPPPAREAPPPPARGAATFSCGFSDQYIPRKEKADVGQVFSYEAPGPGTLVVTYTYKEGKRIQTRYYGDMEGYRSQARVEWSGANVKPGRLQAGRLYKSVKGEPVFLTETTSHLSVAVTAAGPVEFKAYPEELPAYFYMNRWVDNWYDATHTHYTGGGCVLSIEFKEGK